MTPLAGIWRSESVYTVRFLNTKESAIVAKAAANYTDGDSFDIVGADGKVDRKVLGGKVFGKPDELRRLTAIVWPEIRRMANEQTTAALAEDPQRVVVLEAAVLLEAGWQKGLDEVWVVIVEPDIAVQRAMARDGMDEDAIRKRLAAQTTNAERIAAADVVIHNEGDLEMLSARR